MEVIDLTNPFDAAKSRAPEWLPEAYQAVDGFLAGKPVLAVFALLTVIHTCLQSVGVEPRPLFLAAANIHATSTMTAIDARIAAMLARPGQWGGAGAVELCVLTVLDIRGHLTGTSGVDVAELYRQFLKDSGKIDSESLSDQVSGDEFAELMGAFVLQVQARQAAA